MVKNGDMLSKDDVLDVMGLKLIGIVPDDENIIVSSNNGIPIVGSGDSRSCIYEHIQTYHWRKFQSWILRKGIFARLFGKKNRIH